MHQIERYLERLLDLSSANIVATSAVLFVGSIGVIWILCNGWRR